MRNSQGLLVGKLVYRVKAWRFPDEDGVPRVESWQRPLMVRVIEVLRGCPTCGVGADGRAMGYACTRNGCPTMGISHAT